MGSDFQYSLVGIYITCSILIIGTNLFMMGVILFSHALRLKPRNALIVGICVADLLLGCFVTPMFTRTLMESKFPDCHTHLALQITGDHGVFFVVGWTLALINALNLIGAMRRRRNSNRAYLSQVSPCLDGLTTDSNVSSQPHPQTLSPSLPATDQEPVITENGLRPEAAIAVSRSQSTINTELPFSFPCPARCRSFFPPWVKIMLLAALPWVVSTITVVPLVLSNASVHRMYRFEGGHLLEDVMCMLRLPRAVLLAATFLSLYLPFYLCVAALVMLIFSHSRAGRQEQSNSHHSLLNPYRNADSDARSERREPAQAHRLTEVLVDGNVTEDETEVTIQSLPFQQPISSPSTPLIDTMQQDPVTMDTPPVEQSSCTALSGKRNFQARNFQGPASTDSQNLLAFCLPNAIYLMCYTPLLVHTWLHLSRVYTPDHAYGVVLFLLLSRSFLMPLTWLSFTDIRREASEFWLVLTNCASFGPCGMRGRASMSSSSSVSFSRLQENHAIA